MADEQQVGADVAVEIAGQKVNLRNVKSLNTLATMATLLLTCVVGWIIFTHSSEAKDGLKEIAAELKVSNKELSEVLKEMARASRETNCLLAMPPEKRAENVELCKRISR